MKKRKKKLTDNYFIIHEKESILGDVSVAVDNSNDDPTLYIQIQHEWKRDPWWYTFNRGDNE